MRKIILAGAGLVAVGSWTLAQQQPGQPQQEVRQTQIEVQTEVRRDDAQGRQNQAQQQQPKQGQMGLQPRTVTIRQSALWGLSDSARDHLFMSAFMLAFDPEKASQHAMHASNQVEILAAASEGKQKEQLNQAVAELDRVYQQIENREVLSPEQLRTPYAKVLVNLAAASQHEARDGLNNKQERKVAYNLKNAARSLQQAAAWSHTTPSPQISEAIYNADRLSRQMVSLSQPTTFQRGEQRQVRNTPEERQSDPGFLEAGTERPAGFQGQTPAEAIPEAAPKTIDQLGTAIEQLRTQLNQAPAAGQQSR